jgi:hypothetical protein
MAVYLASAHGDERGQAHGGVAGDQTGNELSVRPYYVHSKGWRVFRPLDSEKGLLIAKAAKAACDNPNFGYDQWQRNTAYNVAQKVGFDPSKVDTPCETDCSALVRLCCAYAGIDVRNFDTSTEAAALMATGQFEELTGSKYTRSGDNLRPGDILVTATKGHTETCISYGKYSAPAEPEPEKPATGRKVVVIQGGSCWVRTAPNTKAIKLGAVTAGTQLPYGGQSINGWHLVDYKNRNGWVSGKYSKVVVI